MLLNVHMDGKAKRELCAFYTGASNSNPAGSDWKPVPGKLKQISAGYSCVWGVNSVDDIFYRKETFGDTGDIGSDWIHVTSF